MNKSIEEVLKKLEGLNTIDLVEKKLNVKRSTAIKKIHELRKLGFVETSGGGKQPRIYRVSRTRLKKIGNPGLYDILNKNSPIKLSEPYENRIIGKKLTIEEAIVRAVKTGEYRVILASLALFNKVKSWSKLYQYARKENVRKKIGALYDVARTIIRVRKMDNKTRTLLFKAKEKDRFIVEGLKSSDFTEIQKEWKIKIPFNRADLMRYKE